MRERGLLSHRLPWQLALGALLACQGPNLSNVVYDSRSAHDWGQLDVYQPDLAGSRHAAVLLVHPGAWDSESKADLAPDGARLAGLGFVVANINYRLSTEDAYPAQLHDVWCALAWLRSQSARLDFDPGRVALVGYSAGGHLVEMVGLSGDPAEAQTGGCPNGTTFPPAAVVAGDGPADLDHLPSEGAGTVEQLLGCTSDSCSVANDPSLYAKASPVTYVATCAPPFLLVHGTGDAEVPWQQSQQMHDELQDAGADVALLLVSGAGHEFSPGADLGIVENAEYTIDTPEGWTATVDFLEHHLGSPE